ncbi:hypothetical protein I553_3749 [Mycobacterium xenopi 4042]|uniref:Uncharacterized protein n=1 Tax=Mycobacterium xenopi 4042 TaxID=1299334 RepID=X7YTF1_MYCXE|nr:hypothetical protein I553_3749 [Mycobacterium xenopi 4042]
MRLPAAAGDPAAAAKAAEEEAKLSQLKEQSVMTMARYGQGAAGVKDVAHPGIRLGSVVMGTRICPTSRPWAGKRR